ncbi:MAG TPA: argininosuccinate synthase, partial [Anaeromyxobacteraceae bacterium]|nr:argininosuccinate synthase [Anaeromyxobacteraceae bacterium]
MAKPVKKIVLAYSGGLDTSVILRWLKENYRAEVIAFCADLGQGEELAPLAEKARKTGASKYVERDVREEFARDFVFPALRAGALYEGMYLLGTSLARPVIAKHMVDIAGKEGAEAIAHGATGKGNDQVRFELTAYQLEPNIRCIVPWREWELRGRSDLIAYCKQYRIPVTATVGKPYSTDRNLFHCSHEGGILEDPWAEAPEHIYLMTRDPRKAPDKPRYVEIDFRDGNPVAVDGKKLSPARLIQRMNEIAGEHGVGRLDMVEDRFVGMKVRGVYETPGGTVLHAAHRALSTLTMDREVLILRDGLIPRYAQLVYNGFWYAPERLAMQALVDDANRDVTGTVRVRLYKGTCYVTGRKSERSLFDPKLATFEAEDVFKQNDAEGFIKLHAL